MKKNDNADKTMADKNLKGFFPTAAYFEEHIIKKKSSRFKAMPEKPDAPSAAELKTLVFLILLLLLCTIIMLSVDEKSRLLLQKAISW